MASVNLSEPARANGAVDVEKRSHASAGSSEHAEKGVASGWNDAKSSPTPADPAADPNLPAMDTSWQAWSVCAGCSLGLLFSFGESNGFSAYIQYYQSRYPSTQAAVLSLVGGVQVGTLFAAGLFVGALYDRYGPRPLLIFGTLCGVVSHMLLSITNAVWQVFLVQGILFGLCISTFFITAVAVLPNWFVRYRATAIGIAVAGGSLGGILWPIFVREVTARAGWGWMNRAYGFMALVCLSISTLLIRQRTKPTTRRPLVPDFSLLRKPAFACLFVSVFFGYFGMFGIIFFIAQRGLAVGVNPRFAVYLVCILNTGSVVGRIVPGFVADKIGPLNTVCSALALSLIFTGAAWIPASSEGAVIATGLLYGFSSGAWVSVVPACVPRLIGGLAGLGSAMGLIYLSSVPGALAGASIGSALIDPVAGTGFPAAGATWCAFLAASLAFAIATRLLVDRSLITKV